MGRSMSGSTCGLYTSENAGISSENYVGIIMAEYLRFLGEGSSAQGKSGAKARPKGVVDAQPVDIPVPSCRRQSQSRGTKGLPSGEPKGPGAGSEGGTQEGR